MGKAAQPGLNEKGVILDIDTEPPMKVRWARIANTVNLTYIENDYIYGNVSIHFQLSRITWVYLIDLPQHNMG